MSFEAEKNKHIIEVHETDSVESTTGDVIQTSESQARQAFDPTTGVKRGLKTRHLSMMALASIIGPGIFISLGTALHKCGPLGLMLGFIIIAVLVLGMMSSIGELNTMFDFNFATHCNRWIDPGFGAALGYYYCLLWVCNIISEYVSLTSVAAYYTTEVPTWGWFLIFFTVFAVYQMMGVGVFGEGEYILSFFKIFLLSGFYIFAIIYAAGGIPNHSPGNPFGDNPLPNGFKGIATSFVYAALYYSGVEAISLTAGEAKNPKKAIPIAVRQTIFRILFVYLGGCTAYGITVSYNDPQLSTDNSTLKAPMAIALQEAGWSSSGYFVATAVIITSFSSVNSAVYIASRQLFHLAVNKQAPQIFAKVDKRGNPYVAIQTVHVLGCLSMLSLNSTAAVAYNYIVSIAGVATFIVWTGICWAQYRFRKGWLRQGRKLDELGYVAPFYPYNQIFCMALGIFLCLVQGWATFVPFDVGSFLDEYILLPLFFVMWGAFSYFKKTKIIKYEDMDFVTDCKFNQVIDEEEKPNVFSKMWKNI